MAAFDADPFTGAQLLKPVKVDLRGGKPVLLLDLRGGTMNVRELDKKGRVIASYTADKSYFAPALKPKTVAIELEGDATLHEVLLK